jgi:predicted nucleic acid-binding protein
VLPVDGKDPTNWCAPSRRLHARVAVPGLDRGEQITATAIYHGLELVTGNLKHLQRVPRLRINPILGQGR